MDDRVVSCRVDESLTMWEADPKGTGPWRVFAFEASCCPCETCLSDVEGGGSLADGQT
jgi:hypothetical protein